MRITQRLSPSFGAVVGAAGPRITSYFSNALVKGLLDQCLCAQCLQIIGIIVSGAQHKGAEHNPALDLCAEALGTGSSYTCYAVRCIPSVR